jgi:hypothetical protein
MEISYGIWQVPLYYTELIMYGSEIFLCRRGGLKWIIHMPFCTLNATDP